MLNANEDLDLNKHKRYESMFLKVAWIFIIIGFVNFLINNLIFDVNEKDSERFFIPIAWKLFICFLIFLFHFLKLILFNKGLLDKSPVYYSNRIFWFLVISFSIIYMNVGVWFFIIILLSIMITSLTKGFRTGVIMVVISFVIHAFLSYIAFANSPIGAELLSERALKSYISMFILYIIFGFFSYICGFIYKDTLKYDNENKYLLEQLKEKYFQLEVAQEEIKYQYEKQMISNTKLNDTNKKLSKSIAEFYTLQQISQAISSILDISELLKYLNDIIIGVMGVSYSTIILFDEKTQRLKINTSNVANMSDLAVLNDNINNIHLVDALFKGKHIMENSVDVRKYPFAQDRDINSFICISLSTKSKKYGIALIEHKYENVFDEDNLRLLEIISQQVVIAMENAELYQKMHELAVKDGLTGIFNRQYFQDRLELEVENAKIENCPLSLVIFDIDHFKKFNDTFGHLFGDKVLRSIVNVISSTIRKNDLFARFGGEEFIILFPRTNLLEAYEKAEALRKKLAGHVITDKLVSATITLSFGVSSYIECALTENELLRTADDALYDAKISGRNCVKVARKLD